MSSINPTRILVPVIVTTGLILVLVLWVRPWEILGIPDGQDLAQQQGGHDGPAEPRLSIDNAESSRTLRPGSTVGQGPPEDESGSEEIEEVDAEEVYADLLAKYRGRRLALSGLGRTMPPDLVEEGSAQLALYLVDRATSKPIASNVEIWRIDAPASETWGRGDQKVMQVGVPAGGIELPGLAYGRYRAFVHAANLRAEPSLEFAIDRRRVETRLDVVMPESFHVHIEIHRLDGTRLQFARTRFRIYPGHRWVTAPSWVRRRSPKISLHEIVETVVESDESSAAQPPEFKSQQADSRGFRIGPLPGPSRDQDHTFQLEFDVAPLVGPRVRVSPGRSQRYVSVAVDPHQVCMSLMLTERLNATHLGKHVTIKPKLLRIEQAPGSDESWRDVPVDVSVNIPGFEAQEFRFTARDLPLAPRRLRKLE